VGFGYVIVLITFGLKFKYGWYMTVSTEKVIEVAKSKKHTFSFKADFFHFLVRRFFFDSTRAQLSSLRSI
jgi:hypothetical protein